MLYKGTVSQIVKSFIPLKKKVRVKGTVDVSLSDPSVKEEHVPLKTV